MVAVTDMWRRDEELISEILDWANQRIQRAPDPNTGAKPASELDTQIGLTITPEGIGGHEAMRIFKDEMLPATRAMDHPLNLAFIPSAPTPTAVAFDVAVSAASIFGGLWETGAGAIWAENQALRWLADLADWGPEAGGVFVSGGTIANLSALSAARSRSLVQRDGVRPERWVLAATSEAHSSIKEAARVMDCEVLLVPADDRGAMTGKALASAIEKSKVADGIFAVVTSGGTTNAGTIDDLEGIVDVCSPHGIWVHVDCAYGGAALAAPSGRPKFKGIERVDSFSVDPHKWFFAPYDCAALLYRNPVDARVAHSQLPPYLATVDREIWNPSDYAIHLSRRVRGLPFWFSLATHGTQAYCDAVEKTLQLAWQIGDEIERRPKLTLLQDPDLTVLLFRREGWLPQQYRDFSDENARKGVVMIAPTTYNDEIVMRMVFVNPRTEFEQICGILDLLEA